MTRNSSNSRLTSLKYFYKISILSFGPGAVSCRCRVQGKFEVSSSSTHGHTAASRTVFVRWSSGSQESALSQAHVYNFGPHTGSYGGCCCCPVAETTAPRYKLILLVILVSHRKIRIRVILERIPEVTRPRIWGLFLPNLQPATNY